MTEAPTLHPPNERTAPIVSGCNVPVKPNATRMIGNISISQLYSLLISGVRRLTTLLFPVLVAASCSSAGDLRLHDVIKNQAGLADSAMTVHGNLIEIKPVPFTSLVIARLADGPDTLAIVAPIAAIVSTGHPLRLRGRLYRTGVPGFITIGPVLVVNDSTAGGRR